MCIYLPFENAYLVLKNASLQYILNAIKYIHEKYNDMKLPHLLYAPFF